MKGPITITQWFCRVEKLVEVGLARLQCVQHDVYLVTGLWASITAFISMYEIQRRHDAVRFWREGKGAVLLFYIFQGEPS